MLVAPVIWIEQVERPALPLFSRNVAKVSLIVLNPPVGLIQGEIVVHLRKMLHEFHSVNRALAVRRYPDACSECCCYVVSACHNNPLNKTLYAHTVLLIDAGYQVDFEMGMLDD